jgi:hypothetical protein
VALEAAWHCGPAREVAEPGVGAEGEIPGHAIVVTSER